MDELAQPHCPHCRTVMRDDPAGFRCGGCGNLLNLARELEAVHIPSEFGGAAIHGG